MDGNQNDESSAAENFTCAICLQDYPFTDRRKMPCCGVDNATIQYCIHCLEIIARTGVHNRIGKCPTCPSYFELVNGQPVSQRNVPQTCRMCMQLKEIADPRRELCELCLLGSAYQFRYECDRCHRIQVIPHPMWRYQNTPTEFGTVTWACHQRCGDFTHWRILAVDAPLIPPEHAPASWGLRETWLAGVREIRRGGGRGGGGDANPDGADHQAPQGGGLLGALCRQS
jgi:hypothetical protein